MQACRKCEADDIASAGFVVGHQSVVRRLRQACATAQQCFEPLRGNRSAKEISLHFITAVTLQMIQLRRRFDAFGDHGQAQVRRQ